MPLGTQAGSPDGQTGRIRVGVGGVRGGCWRAGLGLRRGLGGVGDGVELSQGPLSSALLHEQMREWQ